MIDLLVQKLPSHYGLNRQVIAIPKASTQNEQFDLIDEDVNYVVDYKTGNVSFDNLLQTEIQIINYEKYLNELCGTSFEKGRKRCDFLLYEKIKSATSFFILNEQTTALSSINKLSKPILDKKGTVIYPGGKYEKAEYQLLDSLRTLKSVPEIAEFIDSYLRKICLLSYVIIPRKIDSHLSAHQSFNRYKIVEARETGENGALLEQKEINTEGFEYRRINHDFSFKLS